MEEGRRTFCRHSQVFLHSGGTVCTSVWRLWQTQQNISFFSVLLQRYQERMVNLFPLDAVKHVAACLLTQKREGEKKKKTHAPQVCWLRFRPSSVDGAAAEDFPLWAGLKHKRIVCWDPHHLLIVPSGHLIKIKLFLAKNLCRFLGCSFYKAVIVCEQSNPAPSSFLCCKDKIFSKRSSL